MILEENNNEIISRKVARISDFRGLNFQKYFVHILCLKGKATIKINGNPFKLDKNSLAILLPDVEFEIVQCDEKFEATCLSVSFEIMSKNNPDISWGIKGYLFSKETPVVKLSKSDADVCSANFKMLMTKYQDLYHRFRMEIVGHQLQILVMDMWNIFSSEIQKRNVSAQKGNLFERYLQLVQQHCMENRTVEFYAEKLFITPKYLTEISKKASGKTPSEWIENYTTRHLIILLQNTQLNFSEIANTLHFSSLSFFSRYVRKVLGCSPSQYRSRLV
ncbi:helix-turn-helix domain-containing protein [Chryseobacterium gambrini]|uniref:helix-turn-helix domain-containing protein n=1 Tax=Chryseobacterium gambrini TaxID=373672 RepID=UPI0025B48CB0|nr:helix-turn-helix transcriptional regulator [Chryseobacterium gambrini]MDN4029341.1 helix-turn-helix transcriptional regulator [Chryseobacterium gambrini]